MSKSTSLSLIPRTKEESTEEEPPLVYDPSWKGNWKAPYKPVKPDPDGDIRERATALLRKLEKEKER